MGWLYRRVRGFACFALAAFLFLGLVRSGWGSWKEEWEKTIEAAKKEGKIVASIPASAKLRKQMEKTFEKRFAGIDLEPVPGRGSKSIRRISDEFNAGVRYFDLHVGGSSSMFSGLIKPGIVDPIEAYMILQEVKDPKNWWGGHIYIDKGKRFGYAFNAYRSKNFWYNTNLVNPRELRSFDDLLNPKWKGKIAFYDPRRPGAGSSTWSYMWNIKGVEFLKRLVQQDLQVTRNRRVLAESLAKGKLSITIGLTYYSFRQFVEAGLPVKPLPTFKEGTYISGGSGNLAIIKNPPHPNATKVFVNWLLGKEGQEVFTNAMGQPTRRLDVDTSFARKIGYLAAKDGISVEDYYKFENQSEEKLLKVRIPAKKFAKKLLK